VPAPRRRYVVRSRIASVLWLLAVVCALFLAVGALLVAMRADQHNGAVSFVLDGARVLDLGTFGTFTGPDAATQEVLVSWGIAALVYLLVGWLVDRVVRRFRV